MSTCAGYLRKVRARMRSTASPEPFASKGSAVGAKRKTRSIDSFSATASTATTSSRYAASNCSAVSFCVSAVNASWKPRYSRSRTRKASWPSAGGWPPGGIGNFSWISCARFWNSASVCESFSRSSSRYDA